jgi:hypothetical protein
MNSKITPIRQQDGIFDTGGWLGLGNVTWPVATSIKTRVLFLGRNQKKRYQKKRNSYPGQKP